MKIALSVPILFLILNITPSQKYNGPKYLQKKQEQEKKECGVLAYQGHDKEPTSRLLAESCTPSLFCFFFFKLIRS